ncbi:PmoA family protein [Glycomyces paridis]|uniref:Oxidoreductase n=1 Tax=Glycomyces paridis TaxID=2126555 RepID=A0A4S8NWG7_9ACTN|nr:PmoA family protein [Glycomyces paridis]THV21245.1 oxidoreductase [Glycomyces paridis]
MSAEHADALALVQTHRLELGGQAVAEYVWRPHVPNTLSPRPFLHPVRTLSGVEVTEAMPTDHLHHLGASLAVPDVGGANFWGGRTYVRGRGSVPLPNHGVQRHHRWEARTEAVLAHELRWNRFDGTALLRERRRIAARPVDDRAWALDFRYSLQNLTGEPLVISSPGAKGRIGAGYGGFFWRARRGLRSVRILGPGVAGEERLHGARTDWLALAAHGPDPWTLVFVPDAGQGDPWFVRGDDYVGVGPSLAWSEPLTALPGQGPRRRIVTVIADGALGAEAIEGLVETVAAKRES